MINLFGANCPICNSTLYTNTLFGKEEKRCDFNDNHLFVNLNNNYITIYYQKMKFDIRTNENQDIYLQYDNLRFNITNKEFKSFDDIIVYIQKQKVFQ